MSGSTGLLDLAKPNNKAVILTGLYRVDATLGAIAVSDLIAYTVRLTLVIIEQRKECMIILMNRALFSLLNDYQR